MIDTGSSSLAFCNKSLAEEATNVSKVNYGQCIKYGGGVDDFTCPDGSIGSWNFYVGQLNQGDVGVYSNQGQGGEITSMNNVSFAIMDKVQTNACYSPLDGIFGVSYTQGNTVNALRSDSDALSLWNESCKNPDQKSVGNCLDINETTTLPAPLEQTLENSVKLGYNKAEAFGIYLNYAATTGAANNTVIPSLGIYFGGDLALNNQFYNNGKSQVAKTLVCGIGVYNDYYSYMLIFNSIRVPSQNFTHSTTELCQECDQCITDSGANELILPLPKEYCSSKSDADEGSMYFDLESSDGEMITLSLPLPFLREQAALGWVVCNDISGKFVLGPPIFQYYYQAFDMGNKTVTFVDLQLSNETASFGDDSKLGDTTTASEGYLLHQALTTGMFLVLVSCIYL